MQFLVLFTPKQQFSAAGMPADFAELEIQEQAQTRVLYAQGSLRQVWALLSPGRGAAVLFEADTPELLEQVIATFPLIQANYADYQISRLGPHPAFRDQP